MKFTTILLSAAALLCGSIIFIACGGGATNTAANNAKANAPANTTSTTNTTKANDVATTAPAGDSVGVPECDEYIKKYEACLTSIAAKNPQIESSMKTAFEAQRSGFKAAAATPQGKATLATTCKQAIETAKTATTAYACAW